MEVVIKGAPKVSAEPDFVKITKKDCAMVDAGWHRFWARRGVSPPSEYAMHGQYRGLTELARRLQRVTKPDGNSGGK